MLPGAHDDFFKRLGAVQAPTSTHYVFFLNELASELGDGVLNPNEHKVTANTPASSPSSMWLDTQAVVQVLLLLAESRDELDPALR